MQEQSFFHILLMLAFYHIRLQLILRGLMHICP